MNVLRRLLSAVLVSIMLPSSIIADIDNRADLDLFITPSSSQRATMSGLGSSSDDSLDANDFVLPECYLSLMGVVDEISDILAQNTELTIGLGAAAMAGSALGFGGMGLEKLGKYQPYLSFLIPVGGGMSLVGSQIAQFATLGLTGFYLYKMASFITQTGRCMNSFVRDPVLMDGDNYVNYQMSSKDELEAVRKIPFGTSSQCSGSNDVGRKLCDKVNWNRWEANRTKSSDRLTLCVRGGGITPLNVVDVIAQMFTMEHGCYRSHSDFLRMSSPIGTQMQVVGGIALAGLVAMNGLYASLALTGYIDSHLTMAAFLLGAGTAATIMIIGDSLRLLTQYSDKDLTDYSTSSEPGGIFRDNADSKMCSEEKRHIEYADSSQRDKILAFKSLFGPVQCKNVSLDDIEGQQSKKISFDFQGGEYVVKKENQSLCAYLKTGAAKQLVRLGCTRLAGADEEEPLCDLAERISYSVDILDKDGRVIGTRLKHKYDTSKCYDACRVASSCNGKNLSSLAPVPMSSHIYQCIRDTMSSVVYGCSGTIGNANSSTGASVWHKESKLAMVQRRLRGMVMLMLALSLCMFGIKLAIGYPARAVNPSEIALKILKYIMVIYFTYSSSTPNLDGSESGMLKYTKYLEGVSGALSSMVVTAMGGKNGLCTYTAADYKGRSGFSSYMMAFDMLDCRMIYYISGRDMTHKDLGALRTLEGGTKVISAAQMWGYGFIKRIYLMFGSNFILGVIYLFYTVFMFFGLLWAVQMIIISLLFFNILIIVSPFFIPMILFDQTKEVFSQWFQQIVSYSIMAIGVFAFLSFFYVVFDREFYGTEAHFASVDAVRKSDVTKLINGDNVRKFKLFYLSSPPSDSSTVASMARVARDTNLRAGQTDGAVANLESQFIVDSNPDESAVAKGFRVLILSIFFAAFCKRLPELMFDLAGGSRAAASAARGAMDPIGLTDHMASFPKRWTASGASTVVKRGLVATGVMTAEVTSAANKEEEDPNTTNRPGPGGTGTGDA